MKIAVIGGGWYGCHVALKLAQAGHEVTLFEKNSKILSEISGNFGIRLHQGPHYPRSLITREACREGAVKFEAEYPELINKHAYSIYALGKLDADNKPPKVTAEAFKKVCEESQHCREVPLDDYQNVYCAMDVEEPSIVLGERLRKIFEQRLKAAGVTVKCNAEVTGIERSGEKFNICVNQETYSFDQVINTTGYCSLLPPTVPVLPCNMEIVYQNCLAFVYYLKEPAQTFSKIFMDGFFPCVMPYDDRKQKEEFIRKYILTHGKYTILGSYKTFEEAQKQLAEIPEEFIEFIKKLCEENTTHFWPDFLKLFQYSEEYKVAILPKIKTDKEFRSAVTFQDAQGVIYVIPGKINNIFDVEQEVFSLIKGKNIIHEGEFRYVSGGVLDGAQSEISEKPKDMSRNTCGLQTYEEFKQNAQQYIKKYDVIVPIPKTDTLCQDGTHRVKKGVIFSILALIAMVIVNQSKDNSVPKFFGLCTLVILAALVGYRKQRAIKNMFHRRISPPVEKDHDSPSVTKKVTLT